MNFERDGLIGIGLVAAVLGLIVYWFGDFEPPRTDPGEALAQVCEAELEDRLVAPATYRRIEVQGPFSHPATFEEFRGWLTDAEIARQRAWIAEDEDMARLDKEFRDMFAREDPDRVDLALTYEAQNTLGVPLRKRALCTRILGADDDWGAPADLLNPVFIDLETNLNWALRSQ